MPVKTCPVCSGEAGPYRLGTCSPQCDVVLGDDNGAEVIFISTFLIGVVLAALFLILI